MRVRQSNVLLFALLGLLLVSTFYGFMLVGRDYVRSEIKAASPSGEDYVREHLQKNYGVSTVEELQAKYEREAYENYTRQLKEYEQQYGQFPNVGTSSAFQVSPPPKPSQPQTSFTPSETIFVAMNGLSGFGLCGLTFLGKFRKKLGAHKRTITILTVAFVVASMSGFMAGMMVEVHAQSATVTLYPNTYQTESSYIIFTDGTNYGARKGSTGEILWTGTNASYTIQSAINALGTAGGKIFIKAGTYSIKATITGASYITLEGENRNSTILKAVNGLNTHIISTSYITHFVVRNLKIDGNAIQQTAGRGIYSSNDAYNIIENCWIYNTKNEGIRGGYMQYSVITHNYFSDCVGDAITLRYTAKENEISFNIISNSSNKSIHIWGDVDKEAYSNRIIGNRINGGTWGIYVKSLSSQFSVVANNIVEGTSEIGIFIEAGSNIAIVGNTVRNITAAKNGIDTSSSSHSTVISNIIYNVAADGIATDDGKYMAIVGNSIKNVGRHGIAIYQTNNTLVGGNQVWDSAVYGIQLNAAFNNTISGNRCGDTRTPKLQDYGIKEEVGANGNLIISNNCYDNLFGAIHIIGVDTIVRYNLGYVTENSGTATSIQSQTWVSHGCAVKPTNFRLTPCNSTIPVILTVMASNSTKFQVGMWFVNGTEVYGASKSSYNVYWYAEV